MFESQPTELTFDSEAWCMRKGTRVGVLVVALLGAVVVVATLSNPVAPSSTRHAAIQFRGARYSHPDEVSPDSDTNALVIGKVPALGIDYARMTSVRRDAIQEGFTEALFCGYTPHGSFFWHEVVPLNQVVAAAGADPLIFRFVDNLRNLQVTSKGLLGGTSAEENVKSNRIMNANGGLNGVWETANFEGSAILMQEMKFSCGPNTGISFSNGQVYHACGNHGGLHVEKHYQTCQWQYGIRQNQHFLLYYKKATYCSA